MNNLNTESDVLQEAKSRMHYYHTLEVWYLLCYGIFYIFDNLGHMVIMYWHE